MAFDFGSDILVDAMRAADPRQVAEAQTRLRELSATKQTRETATQSFPEIRAEIQRPTLSRNNDAEVLKRFEAVVLTTFVQAMMPKEATAVFGEGLAGDMWKAQMAEQIAGQLAERGGVGIATRLLKDYQQAGEGIEAISGLADPANSIHQNREADSVARFIEKLELETLGQSKDDDADGTTQSPQRSNV